MQLIIENFKKLFFKLEEELLSSGNVDTDKIIELLGYFDGFYRQIDITNTSHFWATYCGSLANILTRWAYSDAEISSNQLLALTKRKFLLSAIYLAGFDFQQKVLLRNSNLGKKFKQNSSKILLLLSINNLNQEFYKIYLTAPKDIGIYLAVGWLAERTQMTKSAAVFHQKIIDDFEKFADVRVDIDFIPEIAKTYMYTTYSTSVGKDKIKGTLHKIIANSVIHNSEIEALNICRKNVRKKPKIMIIHEYFSDTHVMTRIWLHVYKLLEQSYEVFNLTWTDVPSRANESQLKNVVYCKTDLSYIIGTIKLISPDIILYPSLGMSTIAVVLASFRLAPIQLQGFGHPSASHSPFIDGSIHNSTVFSSNGPELYKTYPGYKHGIHLPFTLKNIDSGIMHKPLSELTGKLNIAFNAKVMKLNPEFMIFLRKLNVAQNVTFNFFPAETGTEFLVCKNFIRAYFPDAIVYHMDDYEIFMRHLAIQDLAICPFPFGNTNGILDCIHLELPTFVLQGSEVCSSAEFDLLTHIGAVDCIFRTKKSLKLSIERFISDEQFRNNVTDAFKKAAIRCKKTNNIFDAQKYEAKHFANWINEHAHNYRCKKDI